MPRRQRRGSDTTPLLVISWWLWLVLAALAFAVFHWMANLPRGTSGPEVVARSLLNGIGYVGRLIAPTICLIAAALAFIAQRRRVSAPYVATTLASERPSEGARTAKSVEGDLYEIWKDAAPPEPIRAPDTNQWNLELLRALEWKRLELLCALYFRAIQFRVEESGPGPDGGIDLRLFIGSEDRPGVLVQCKAWNTWKVGVKAIRELFGVMAAEGVSEGIFVTTSTFSVDAVEFARGKNIALIDGEDLLRKLSNLPETDQTHILRLTTAGDFMTPTCASCGNKMIERAAKDSGKRFWGCPRFPACRTTLPMSISSSTPE